MSSSFGSGRGGKNRRRSWLSDLFRLEDRLTPALTIMGPHTAADLQILAETRATAWSALTAAPTPTPGQTPAIAANNAWYFRLNQSDYIKRLNDAPSEFEPGYADGSFIVSLPRPDGTFQRFQVWSMSMMEAGLADQFPEWATFRGQGIDDPSAALAASFTSLGFAAQVLSTDGNYYIDPYFHLDQSAYVAYYRKDLVNQHGDWTCTVDTSHLDQKDNASGRMEGHDDACCCSDCQAAAGLITANKTTNGTVLRTYRTAVAATGEYTAFFGGTVANAQAAIVAAINRVSGVYEKELAIRLTLVANNTSIVYTDAASDPYTNGNGSAMLGQNQTNLDAVIGSANYDLGHVFSTGGGGVAGLGVVGQAGVKARGVTGSSSPTGDAFWIDYVAHEMGHQFGANHTFNGTQGSAAGNRNGSTAYEPGSGSTIMGYAGICGTDNLQSFSDAVFNFSSLDEITNYVTGVAAAGGFTQVATGNTPPTANAGPSYTIPANTPFFLTGSGSDADGDAITYLWEERDLGPAQAMVGQTDNGASPIFRVFTPTASPTRFFPQLSSVLNGTSVIGEILPTTNRTMNFRLTVRDNKANGGAYTMADTTVKSVVTGSAFQVTAPNTAVTWTGGGVQTVTWNVAGTTGNGINAALVDIALSTDGGLTFPTLLAAGTPNDGSETVTIPNLPTGTARIRVKPTDNIFYDVSDTNFTIVAGSSFSVSGITPAAASRVTAPLTQVDVAFSATVNAATVAPSDLQVSVGSVTAATLIDPTTVRFTIAGVTSETDLTLTIPANAISDTSGNGVNPYTTSYVVDIDTAAFPTPLTAVGVPGVMAFTGSQAGTIDIAADTDAFTVDLDAGQYVTVTLTGSASLRGSLQLTGPGGVNVTAFAPAVGGTALLQSVPTPVAGTYTITVGAITSTTGTYTARLDLNSAVESAAPKSTVATAQPLTAGVDLGGGASLLSVRGQGQFGVGSITNEIEPNGTTATASDDSGGFSAVTSKIYEMTISGSHNSATDTTDYFNIGAMQVGDTITLTMSGQDGGRGTHTDPWVRLYRAGASGSVTGNDDRVAGTTVYYDSLVYRFVVSTADTYYVRSSIASGTGGTYQLGVRLENVGAAPTLGTGQFTETEGNNSIATANNASSAWRRINYNATVAGSISSNTDVDFYRFFFNAGDVVSATATSSGGADLAVAFFSTTGQLYDEKGVSDALGSNSAMYSYSIPTTGSYFVRVSGINGTTGPYSLSVDLGSSIPPPAATPGLDFYSFAATAGQPLSLGLDQFGAGTVSLELVDATNTVLATGVAGSTTFDRTLNFVPTATGTLYARVAGTPGVDYQLAVARGAALDAEPNSSFGLAQPLADGRAVGSISPDDDWYTFTANAGQLLTLTTTTPGGGPGEFVNTLDPLLELYGPAATLIGSDDNSAGDGRNARVSLVAPATGDYRVRVTQAGGTSGAYVLNLAVSTDPPAQVSGTVVDDGSVQRSRVRSVTVTFNEVVTLPTNPADAFQLVRTSAIPADTIPLTASVVNGTSSTTVTLTFSGPVTDNTSLADGLYTLTALAGQITDAGGQPLDGDANGAPGGDFALDFHRLFGDVDGNRTVSTADFLAFRLNFLSTNPAFDADNSGSVDAADFLRFRFNFLATI